MDAVVARQGHAAARSFQRATPSMAMPPACALLACITADGRRRYFKVRIYEADTFGKSFMPLA